MNIYIPKPNTIRYRIIDMLFDKGVMSLREIREEFINSITDMHNAIEFLMMKDSIETCEGGFQLKPATRRHWALFAQPEEKYVGEKAAPRTATPFKPLKSVPWAQHLEKIRAGMSFMNGSSSFANGVR